MAQIYQDILGPLLAQIKGAENPVSAFMGGRRQSMLDNLAIADEARKKQQDDILNQYRLAQMAMIGQLTPYQQASLGIQRQQLDRQAQNDEILRRLRESEISSRGVGGRYTPQLIKLQDAQQEALEQGDSARAEQLQAAIAKLTGNKSMQTAAAQLSDLKNKYDTTITPEAIEDFIKYSGPGGEERLNALQKWETVKGFVGGKPTSETLRVLNNINNMKAVLATANKVTASSLNEPQTNEGLRQAKAMIPQLMGGLSTPENTRAFFQKGLPSLIQQYAQANTAGNLDPRATLSALAQGQNPIAEGASGEMDQPRQLPFNDKQKQKLEKVVAQLGPTLKTLPGLSGGVSSQVTSENNDDLTPEEVERLKALGYSR